MGGGWLAKFELDLVKRLLDSGGLPREDESFTNVSVTGTDILKLPSRLEITLQNSKLFFK